MSKTELAILGILTVEPMSGYDIKRFCDQSLAHFWRESYGTLYPRLKRLAEDGLVRGRQEARTTGPDAIVYSITPTGRRRFREWLRTAPAPDRIHSELLLQVFFGSQSTPARVATVIRAERVQQRAVKRRYAQIAKLIDAEAGERPHARYWRAALRRGELLTDARIQWCDETLRQFRSSTR